VNTYSFLIVFLILATTCLDAAADLLNLKKMRPELPQEFQGVYEAEKYRTSLQYQRENSRADTVKRTILVPTTLIFIFAGGFNAVDLFARHFDLGPIVTGLLFVGILSLLRTLVSLPFSLYDTFVIEEKYGFNRTTPRTFVSDLLKGFLLGALFGAPIFAGIQYFFQNAGPQGWLYSWAGVTAFQLVLVFLAPVLLMPLFNKFSPIPESPLKNAIEAYAKKESFQLQGIFTMDGSKRSTKANAFFTGFGPFRRLVLFDTLIEKQTTEELTAVVAHEIGHFKRGHIIQQMALSIAVMGAVFFTFSLFLGNEELFAAFRMEHLSVYASLVFISVLYTPIFRIFGILTQLLSRKFEFEADEYSVRTYGNPEAMVSALKKLSIDSLSNLTPHPLKVWLDYTHPPVLERIFAIRALRVLRTQSTSNPTEIPS
jgi:STE24 endopeptidase